MSSKSSELSATSVFSIFCFVGFSDGFLCFGVDGGVFDISALYIGTGGGTVVGFCSFSGAGQLDVFCGFCGVCCVFLNCGTGSGTSVVSEGSCCSCSTEQSDVICCVSDVC